MVTEGIIGGGAGDITVIIGNYLRCNTAIVRRHVYENFNRRKSVNNDYVDKNRRKFGLVEKNE